MSKNKIFLFFGPPGSGKGSLSSMCVEHFGWQHVSTGDLCREQIKLGTDIGKQIKSLTEQGLFVSDELIADMLAQWMMSQKELSQDIILDGYPRTKKQADILSELMRTYLPDFDLTLVKLNMDLELLADRIVHRVLCSNKKCGQIYSTSHISKSRPKVDMKCDKCDSVLVKRSDDTLESLKLRLQEYYKHEQDVLDFYIDKGMKIEMLNGNQSVQNVFEDFKKIVRQ